MLWGGESSERVRLEYPGEGTHPMHQETFELNCSRTSLAMDGTLVVVVEMSLSTWLVCAEVPGLERRAMMKPSFCHSCTVGAMRLRKEPTAGSLASALLTRPVATVFGWRAVCEVMVSKRM